VILYGERLVSGPRGTAAATALLNVASRLGLAGRDGAGLLEIPASANGRGIREAGFAGGHGPGYAPLEGEPLGAAGIAEALAGGSLSTLYLLHADPLRTHPDRALWERALASAQTVIAHEATLTDTLREHATVVFPAEAYAEKEGTLVHPDGRLQRLRPAIGRPRPAGGALGTGVRPGWQVISEVARRAGHDLRILAGPMASKRLFDAVPFYAGLTLDAIGGRGVRWPATEAAGALTAAGWEPAALDVPPPAPAVAGGALRLGTWRSLWASKEVDLSPALRFLRPRQVVELSPVDADRLGIRNGDQVEVGSDGTRVRGAVRLRASIPGGSVFLVEGTNEEPANTLTEPLVEVRRVGGGDGRLPDATSALVTPAGEGHGEAPASAPMTIPDARGGGTIGGSSQEGQGR
jgi:NADH-quinone oxidoreductase subunit G